MMRTVVGWKARTLTWIKQLMPFAWQLCAVGMIEGDKPT